MNQGFKILVGIDNSENSLRAIDWAAAEAKTHNGSLILFHAIDLSYIYYSGYVAPQTLFDEMEAISKELIKKAIERAKSISEIECEGIIKRASAAKTLIELSKEADLMVIGARGESGLLEHLVGSVTRRVVAHSSCPVVVVH
jgi:nucleotide-binding universal stress UspA family protein